jgi:protein-L-isoaspartate(D-aspartate) O-methyltransferase
MLPDDAAPRSVMSQSEDTFASRRVAMVERQIKARGVEDRRVLAAMEAVPRHLFVPPGDVGSAYDDSPQPIGHGQTISQPYIVAYMSELLRVEPSHKVLEVGTGCGYQAAVLSMLAAEVYTIEIVEPLAVAAEARLRSLGYRNVHVRVGDGFGGWPDQAPFDRIMVTAAPTDVPPPLLEQLSVGGRLVIPVGDWNQEMTVVTKTPAGIVRETTIPVRFVPLTRRPGA